MIRAWRYLSDPHDQWTPMPYLLDPATLELTGFVHTGPHYLMPESTMLVWNGDRLYNASLSDLADYYLTQAKG